MNTENLAPSPQRTQRRRGFTLIELLIVVAIIAILATVAFPALKRSVESAKTVKCLSNLKQLGQATLAYSSDHEQFLPPVAVTFSGGVTYWYLEMRMQILETTNRSLPRSTKYPQGRNLDIFYCPSVSYQKGYPHTHYAANLNVFDPSVVLDQWNQTKTTRIESASKIVMYSEVLGPTGSIYPESNWTISPNIAKQNPNTFFPHRHGETVNMVFCDAHAENVPRSEVVNHFTNYFGDRELWK